MPLKWLTLRSETDIMFGIMGPLENRTIANKFDLEY